MQKENSKKIGLGIVGILVLVGVFYGGMVYGKGQNSGPMEKFRTGMPNGIDQPGENKKMSGLGMVSGEIISKDDKSITIKSMDGGSKIVFFDTNTAVSKMVSGALTDLIVGTQISGTGTTNTDGSVTAKSIQIRPNVSQNAKVQ